MYTSLFPDFCCTQTHLSKHQERFAHFPILSASLMLDLLIVKNKDSASAAKHCLLTDLPYQASLAKGSISTASKYRTRAQSYSTRSGSSSQNTSLHASIISSAWPFLLQKLARLLPANKTLPQKHIPEMYDIPLQSTVAK